MGTDIECAVFTVLCDNELVLNEADYSVASDSFDLCWPLILQHMTSEIMQL